MKAMTTPSKAFKAPALSDQKLSGYDATTYPLGVVTGSGLLSKVFASRRTPISISSTSKNDNNHGGLLILGWGGAGKTSLANSIIHKATQSGQQVVRYHEHEQETYPSSSVQNIRDSTVFLEILKGFTEVQSLQQTLVVIDSLEAFIEGYEGNDENPNSFGSSTSKLNELLEVKASLEDQFGDKILFVVVYKEDYRADYFKVVQTRFAMTVTGLICAHYAIEPLWDKTSPSRFFSQVNDLQTGEFMVLGSKGQTFKTFLNRAL